MFRNNVKDNMQYRYFDIQYTQQPSGRRVWFAWYYKTTTAQEALTEVES